MKITCPTCGQQHMLYRFINAAHPEGYVAYDCQRLIEQIDKQGDMIHRLRPVRCRLPEDKVAKLLKTELAALPTQITPCAAKRSTDRAQAHFPI